MSGKKQPLILAVIVALVVSAAPVASAFPYSLQDSMVSGYHVEAAPLKAGSTKTRIGAKAHLEEISIGAGKDRGW